MRRPTSPTPSPTRSAGPERIAKLLARAGVASRREVERMIAEGRVALDGEKLTTPAITLSSLRGVTVDERPVAAPAPARLFLYHKPPGLLVTERDPRGRPTIYDRLPRDLPRVVPVGRLDLNTEGLLLLTTDGELKRQLELPATGVERAYRARAYGPVTQAALEELIHGVEIEGIRYGPIDANLERRTGANVWVEMILTEGKNREVRRVLEHLGLEVSRLIRTRYGPFVLADLAPGEVGEVRGHDIAAFRRSLDRGKPVTERVAVRAPVAEPARPVAAAPRPARATDRGGPVTPFDARRRPAPRRDEAPAPSEERRTPTQRSGPARSAAASHTRPSPRRREPDGVAATERSPRRTGTGRKAPARPERRPPDAGKRADPVDAAPLNSRARRAAAFRRDRDDAPAAPSERPRGATRRGGPGSSAGPASARPPKPPRGRPPRGR